MKIKIIIFLVIFSLLVIPTRSAVAAGDVLPADPGVVSAQDASIQETLDWMIRQPPALSLPICSAAATIDRASLDAIALKSGNYGYMRFSGFDASLTRVNSSGQVVFSRFSNVRNDAPLPPPPSNNCDSLIDPGLITLIASKVAPTNPVVVGQDPYKTGVDLIWTVNILPTIYTYGRWEAIPYPDSGNCQNENAECNINESGKSCCLSLKCDSRDNPSGNGICVRDYAMYPDIYDCVDHSITYREDIASLEPKAILTTASRNWILGDLARAYPGTSLRHSDWGFRATEPCIWNGSICVWTHIEGHVQVVDPGWYDLMITGTTTGTNITLPRLFTLTGGHFGVYLVETSITGQP